MCRFRKKDLNDSNLSQIAPILTCKNRHWFMNNYVGSWSGKIFDQCISTVTLFSKHVSDMTQHTTKKDLLGDESAGRIVGEGLWLHYISHVCGCEFSVRVLRLFYSGLKWNMGADYKETHNFNSRPTSKFNLSPWHEKESKQQVVDVSCHHLHLISTLGCH